VKKAIFAIGLALCVGAQQKSVGSLDGVVAGTGGDLIGGAAVEMVLIDPPNQGTSRRPRVQFVRSVLTGTEGAFHFEQLPLGKYAICVRISESEWLGSCTWGAQPLVAEVVETASKTVEVVLRKGAAISVQIEDVGGALARHEEKTAGAHLLIGVGGDDKLFRPAQIITNDGTSRLYRSVVPFDTPVRLVVASALFRLADERGAPIEATTTAVPVRVASGQVLPPVRLLVTGTRIQ